MSGIDRVHQKVALASSLVRGGNVREVSNIIGDKTWASLKGLGLHRDLSVPFETPAATIPISIVSCARTTSRTLIGTEDPDPLRHRPP